MKKGRTLNMCCIEVTLKGRISVHNQTEATVQLSNCVGFSGVDGLGQRIAVLSPKSTLLLNPEEGVDYAQMTML